MKNRIDKFELLKHDPVIVENRRPLKIVKERRRKFDLQEETSEERKKTEKDIKLTPQRTEKKIRDKMSTGKKNKKDLKLGISPGGFKISKLNKSKSVEKSF